MEWNKLLVQERVAAPDYAAQPNRPIYLQDADRITFSAPFRRLANKTQVHPLYDHDHIHHRLIHSIEVSSVGRSLGMSVGHWLEQQKLIEDGDRHIVSGVIQAACLAHDIGNPPFGHSGEDAIGNWFQEQFCLNTGLFGSIDANQQHEFTQFEGNAQGFRLLTNLEMYRNDGGMRLSMAVLGAFTKYPVTAVVKSSIKDSYCGLNKFGIFETESTIWSEVAEKTGLVCEQSVFGNWWRRHPLVFLVEAADDICYNILDLEDAFVSGDIEYERVAALLNSISGKPNKSTDDYLESEAISYFRARAIGSAIEACVEAFKANHSEILDGSFSSSLIEMSSVGRQFAEIKDIARRRIFTAKRKTELEVAGRNVLRRTLNGLLAVFDELQKKAWDAEKLSAYNLQLVRALELDLREANDPYKALHCLTDYVSGMTDRYAVKVAKLVSGVP